MAYSEDYRRRVVEYYHEGNSPTEVQEIFKVHPKTLRDCESRMENGNLKAVYPIKPESAGNYPQTSLLHMLKKTPTPFCLR